MRRWLRDCLAMFDLVQDDETDSFNSFERHSCAAHVGLLPVLLLAG